MAKLWFRNSKGQERIIAEVHNYKEITTAIDNFIAESNEKYPDKTPFKRYYTRMWNEDGRAKFDVGSWSEFFFLDRPWPEINTDTFESEYEAKWL